MTKLKTFAHNLSTFFHKRQQNKAILCKAKMRYLLTLEVSRYSLLKAMTILARPHSILSNWWMYRQATFISTAAKRGYHGVSLTSTDIVVYLYICESSCYFPQVQLYFHKYNYVYTWSIGCHNSFLS